MDAIDIRQYLLGRLPDDRQTRVEEEFMIDDEIFTHLLVEEDEIIDDYLRGSLDSAERDSFEHYFLAAPERRRKLAFAQSFHAYIDAHSREPQDRQEPAAESWWRKWFGGDDASNVGFFPYAAVAVVALIGLLGGIRMFQQMERLKRSEQEAREQIASLQKREMDLQERIARMESELADQGKKAEARQLTHADLERAVAQLKQLGPVPSSGQAAPQPAIPVFALLPFTGRGVGGLPEVKFPADAKFILLDLGLEEDDALAYDAALLSNDGSEAQRWPRLMPDKVGDDRRLRVRVPTTILRNGEYVMRLQSIAASGNRAEAGRYAFKCERLPR